MVDERTRELIEQGRRIRAALRQPQFAPLAFGAQWALLAVSESVLDEVPLDGADAFRAGLARHCLEAVGLDDRTATLSAGLQGRPTAALNELARSVAGPAVGDRR
jgi:F-type H+-transporting ATPase subunit alpha